MGDFSFYGVDDSGFFVTLRQNIYLITQVSQVQNLWYKSNKEGISPPKGDLQYVKFNIY